MGKYMKLPDKNRNNSSDDSVKRPSKVVQLLILLLTITAVLITIFLANRSYHQHRDTALVQFNKQQLILAHSAAAGIETIFNEVSVALSATARIPAVQQMEPGCLEYMRNVYQGFLPKTSIRRLDEDGILRFIYPFEGWRKEIVGRSYSNEKFFRDAKENGDVTVSGIVINEDGSQRIRIVTPVYHAASGSDIFKGLLAFSFDLSTISEAFITPITSGKTGYAWLINQDGVFLSHYEKEFIGQDIFTVRMNKSPTLPLDSIHAIQKQMLIGNEGSGRYISGWHRGETGTIEKLIAYSPVHIGDKIWSVAVVAPVNEVDEIIRDAGLNTLYSFGFVVFTLLVGGSLLFMTSYRWSSSLEREVKTRTSKLRETTDHLNNLIRSANAPIVVWDPARRVTIINQAFEEMSGRTEKEMLGHPIDLFFSQDNLQDALHKLIHDTPETACKAEEIPILRTDGTVRIGKWSSSNVYADDGITLIATIAHGEDITERKQAEEALHRSEERFKRAVENMPFDFFLIDKSGRYAMQNSFCRQGWGNLIGKRPSDMAPSREIVELWEENNRRAFSGETVREEVEYLINGEKRYIFNIIAPITEDDVVEGILGINIDVTERKQAEEALRKSEAQYKAVVETQTELICRYAPDYTLTFVNEAYCRYFADMRENLIGSNFMSFVPDEYHKGIDEIHCILLTLDVQEVTHEHPIMNATGEVRWQQWVYHAIFDDHHQLIEYQSVGRDITELKKAEEALQRSEGRYRSLFEGSPDAVFIADSESGRVIDANPAALELIGKSRDEIIGIHFQELHPPHMREYEEGTFVAHCKEGSDLMHESLILRADGTEVPVEIVAHEINIGGKNLAQGIFRNITERKRTEEALQNTMRNLALSQEMAQLGSWEWDITTDEMHWSDQTYRLFGWKPHEIDVSLASYTRQISPDDRNSVLRALKGALNSTEPYESEHRIIRKDGIERLHHTYGEIKYDTLGNPAKMVGIVQDITERRQAEEEKWQLESQLSHAQKMKTLGTLVAGVAHEINNPINKIIFDIPLLQKIWHDVQSILHDLEALAPEKKYGGLSYDFLRKHLPQLLSDMDMAANRVAKTVSNLKDFTRQSSIADRAPMHINAAVENAVRIIETTLKNSGTALTLNLAADLPLIEGNLQSIEQVIINITINAIQAIDHDHGRIEIATGMDTHERYIFVTVSDNGSGIDPSIAEMIFDPFITSRHNEGGTGLGLSITRNLVEAHGGKVTYMSNQGKGTTFTLLLPSAEHTI